jgi:hypothetical protein
MTVLPLSKEELQLDTLISRLFVRADLPDFQFHNIGADELSYTRVAYVRTNATFLGMVQRIHNALTQQPYLRLTGLQQIDLLQPESDWRVVVKLDRQTAQKCGEL